MTVVLVEEDARIAMEKEVALNAHSISSIVVGDASTAVEFAAVHHPDAVLASATTPPAGSMDLCRRMQRSPVLRHCSLLVYSRRYEALEAALFLEAGAADYFSVHITGREMAARLRRASQNASLALRPAVTHVGEMIIDKDACEVTCRGRNIGATATEFKVLLSLTHTPGVVLSRERIAELSGVEHFDATDRTVDTHIKNIRRKLGVDGVALQTVRGFGYRIRPTG